MRKKLLILAGVIVVMAVVLSVTAFAADGTQMTDYGIITVMFEKISLNIKAIFNAIDAIYVFFRNLFT